MCGEDVGELVFLLEIPPNFEFATSEHPAVARSGQRPDDSHENKVSAFISVLFELSDVECK